MQNIYHLLLPVILFVFFGWFAIVSLLEKESLAFKRSLLLSISTPLPFFALMLIEFQSKEIIALGIIAIIIILFAILFLPVKGKIIRGNEIPFNQIDERDTMFSRKEISGNPEKLESYYKNKINELKIDREWRNKPGLMSEKGSMFSTISFKAADASFFPIENLRDKVDGLVNPDKKNFDDIEITQMLEKWSKKLGAKNFGVCKLKEHHLYSVRGRGAAYGKKVINNHSFAIAITVEMDKDFLATGPAGPTLMESAQQYLNSGIIAIQIAKFIRDLGHEARAHIDGNYEVICPLVARDAGLGEIGRMGLLMTPELGPRVRIAVVTTNLPLIISERKPDYSVHDFCTICKKCAHVCPSQAIGKNNMELLNGALRWQINQEKCFSYWCISGTDCGRCMSVCPYSHPNNLLHNLVRWGIKKSWFFRRFALAMDDFFYGRKPKPAKIPEWLNISEKPS